MPDTSSPKTLVDLLTSFAAANVYEIIDATLDEDIDGNPITEIPALGVYRSITTSELHHNVEEVTQRIKTFSADLTQLLSGLHTDATMALSDNWDRSDEGFNTQQELISDFAAKYGIELVDTTKEEYECPDQKIL